jgi:cytochrome c551/c552
MKSEQLEKVESLEPDPIADRSLSGPILVSSLLLIGALLWALYDEIIGQRPWKGYQERFIELYERRLTKLRPQQKRFEEELKQSPEYQELDRKVRQEEEAIAPRVKEITARMSILNKQLADITPVFQDIRAKVAALTYEMETTGSPSRRRSLQERIDREKQTPVEFELTAIDGSDRKEEKKLNYYELEALYTKLREDKAKLLSEQVEVTKRATELRKERDKYLQDNLVGLSEQQIEGLIKKVRDFKIEIKQIALSESTVVDRCESCHLGIREPVVLTAKDMGGERVFASHPESVKDLLKIHPPERFGCSTCHGGNGRATTSVQKAHGRYKHWLWPLYHRENVQAGCNQCHDKDRITAGADVLNRGKDLYENRGCIGCHRYEGFDREWDALAAARQNIKQLEMERDAYRNEIRQIENVQLARASEEQAQRLLRRIESLKQMIARVETKIDQIDLQSKYLMQDVKKVGPNLKEIRAKLRKEWIPVWLRNPQAFRPGTKMPTYRFTDEEVRAISAFLWQSALNIPIAKQLPGDPQRGKELFKSIGCLACHSIDGRLIDLGEGRVGGNFAADLSRVGEKANYDYIVRWIYNPRQRLAPYSPSLKRDLLPEDYSKKGLPFIFDSEHSKSPIDGRELLVQNMTVMPSFRLTEQEARDIASFLASNKRDVRYPDAPFMDDPALAEKGAKLVRFYGCAGCHEIKGLEDEQKIGTELTKEGSKPIERLDFALLTHDAKRAIEPFTGRRLKEPWYNHKGFFEYKLRDPAIYDRGKEKEPQDRLRMPNLYLTDEEITALTTFLLGSVEAEIPEQIRYKPVGQKKDVQDGWWVIKKYNCVGCHNVLVGQDPTLASLPIYQGEASAQLPPRLTEAGARLQPDWLLKFLKDPSLATESERQSMKDVPGLGKQFGLSRNGIRRYLRVRMPTFNFSPNELQALVNFFMGTSSQPMPYIAEHTDPLTPQEQELARALFTSPSAPCLRCHMTGDPAHDARASAPNFLTARERLKPDWMKRWLLDPQIISPGTTMPSGLFKRDPERDRWVFAGPTPPQFQQYDKDHVALLVRYMVQLTPEEQRRVAGSASQQSATQTASGRKTPTKVSSAKRTRDTS